jgi:hypothetical protein
MAPKEACSAAGLYGLPARSNNHQNKHSTLKTACTHPTDQWKNEPDEKRHDWIRTECRNCGRFLGYCPNNPRIHYKIAKKRWKEMRKKSKNPGKITNDMIDSVNLTR